MLFGLGLAFLAPAAPAGPLTENLIVIFVGGIRESELMEDPLHEHAPHLWNDLRPLGSWHRRTYQLARTGQLSGEFEATTGVFHGLRGGWHSTAFPTWVETWIDSPAGDAGDVVVYARPTETPPIQGTHPLLSGSADSVFVERGSSDTEVTRGFIEAIRTRRPRIGFLVLNDADRAAQYSPDPWNDYIRAVEVADSLVWRVALAVRRLEGYGDRTAIVVTDYHGRNDRRHGDFYWHGDSCNGCRNITFLALGPDFAPGAVIESPLADLRDVATTCAALMGAPFPYTEGRVMNELFLPGHAPEPAPFVAPWAGEGGEPDGDASPQPPDRPVRVTQGRSLYPDIEIRGGVLHVAWSEERLGSAPLAYDVLAVQSTDGGRSWSEADTVVGAAPPRILPHRVGLGADEAGSAGCVYAASAVCLAPYPVDSAFVWKVAVATRPDSSRTLEPPVSAGALRYWSETPTVADREGEIFVVGGSSFYERSTVLAHRPDSSSTLEATVVTQTYTWSDAGYPDGVAAARDASGVIAVETLVAPRKSVLHLTRWFPGVEKWGEPQVILAEPWPIREPSVAVDPTRDRRHVVWEDGRDGPHRLYATRSDGRYGTWLPPLAVAPGFGPVWEPDLWAGGGRAVVVWEELSQGRSRIFASVSRDAGVHWDPPVMVTSGPGLSSFPRVTSDGETAFVVWQDLRSGNWDVWFRAFPL